MKSKPYDDERLASLLRLLRPVPQTWVAKAKRIPLGPWGVNVTLSARQAHEIRHSLAYRKLIRPALTALEGIATRGRYWTGELPAGATGYVGIRAVNAAGNVGLPAVAKVG